MSVLKPFLVLMPILTFGCGSESPISIPTQKKPIQNELPLLAEDLKHHINKKFRFTAPSDLIEIPSNGEDSFIGTYKNSDFLIDFDYGWYSDNSFEGRRGHPEYKFESITIHDKKAILGNFENNQHPKTHPFVYSVYIDDIYGIGEGKPGITSLYFRVCYKQKELSEQAKLVLLSLRFNRDS